MEKLVEKRTEKTELSNAAVASRAFVEKYNVVERINMIRSAKDEKALLSYSYLEKDPIVLLEIPKNSAAPSAALGVVALRVLAGKHKSDGPLFTEIKDAIIAHGNTTDAIREKLEKDRQNAGFFGFLRNQFTQFNHASN